MKLATEHFEKDGWTVEDVGSFRSWDLECVREGEELHVEVKGTTGLGESVILTANEVTHAREFDNVALFVVASISLARSVELPPVASGGNSIVHHPWSITDSDLKVTEFRYTVPKLSE